MINIDNKLLEELGLGDLPEEEKKSLLAQLLETLQFNVGTRLAAKMNDQQLDEFEVFVNNDDQPAATAWLEENMPEYKDIVSEELDKLKAEIKKSAEVIKQQLNEA